MRRIQLFCLISVGAWISVAPPARVAAQNYIVIDLGVGVADGINNQGQVVGQFYGANNDEAFVWSSGTLTLLPSLVNGGEAEALAIDDSGHIVGWSETSYGFNQDHGVLWQNGTVHDLGTLSGGGYSWASAINNAGRIVGYAENSAQLGSRDRACVSDSGSAWVSLGTLPGAAGFGTSYAEAINEGGVIGGSFG